MKKYKYICHTTTPASKHVHCDRVKAGEEYLISKTSDPDFVSITGNLYDKDFGMDRVYEKWLNIKLVKDYCKLKN